MTEKLTILEALKLVSFKKNEYGDWFVSDVHGDVYGSVNGDVCNHVQGHVLGDIGGNVGGNIDGTVRGTINDRKWQFIETPKEKLKRLIEEGASKHELLEAFNQLEES